MQKKLILVSSLILLIFLSTCTTTKDLTPDYSRQNDNWIDQHMQTLTLNEKIGQMILMARRAAFLNKNSDQWKTIQHDIKDNNVFGYHFWGGDALTLYHYTKKMQKMAKTPLIFTADFERGAGFLIEGATTFPFNMAFGAARDTQIAYQFGKYSALESRLMGINQIFNPVVDINNNPANPIINIRSFGETPELVNKMASAYMRGCQSENVSSCAKHFPGHGNTASDSHLSLPVIYSSKSELEKMELRPFKKLIDEGVYSVMSAHISLPNIQKEPGLPATLSPKILNGLLRSDLNFEGVVYTDAMEMGGIVNNFTREYSYVQAIKAGCDVLINSGNRSSDSIITAIKTAIDKGRLSEARIDSSVKRILTLKKKLGLHRSRYSDQEKLENQLASEEIKKFAQEAAEKGITLPLDKNQILPLDRKYKDAYVISIYDNDHNNRWNAFNQTILARIPGAKQYLLDPETSQKQYASILENISDSSLVIAGVFARYQAFKGRIELFNRQIDFIKQLSEESSNLITVSLGNPYIIQQFPGIDTYLCSFGWEPVQQRAAVRAIFGEFPIQGKMPITIPGLIQFGDGIQTKKQEPLDSYLTREKPEELQSLKRGFPYEAGVASDTLDLLDSILVAGVQDSAFPGATFLAAKDGIILHQKAVGNFTYQENAKNVNPGTIYDLASVTKVVSTTSAAMLLYERGQLELDTPVYKIIPEFGQKGKKQITFRHLLTHSSGLPGWAPLWKKGDTAEDMVDAICEMELEYETGEDYVYSCMGFIILGKVVEKITGMPLSEFVKQEVFEPLGMEYTFYNPPQEYCPQIPPTEYDSARGGFVHCQVHDENAYYLGGVSGNAGLFSNVHDLAIFCQMLLNKGIYQGTRIFQQETVDLFTKRQNIPEGTSRCLGWDTPSGNSSSGRYFSTKTYGHLGFTGTSIWIDPVKNMFGILLTNRVHPTRENNQIYHIRYKTYDKLQKAVQDYPLKKNPNVWKDED